MTRKEKIEKAKKLTIGNRGHNIRLTTNYLEGTPEKIGAKITAAYEKKDERKNQIWYIDKNGTAQIVR